MAGEKLLPCFHGPRRLAWSINYQTCQVGDHWFGRLTIKPVSSKIIGLVEDVHGPRLKFNHDLSLDQEAVMLHVVASETDKPVQHFMRLIETDDGWMV